MNKLRIETMNSQNTKDWHVFINDVDISGSISSLSFHIDTTSKPAIYLKFTDAIEINGCIPVEDDWTKREPWSVPDVTGKIVVTREDSYAVALDLSIGST